MEDNFVDKFETKSDFLSYCAKEMAERYPRGSSYRFVAERVGISASSFQRIAKKEIDSPNFYNALKLVKSVCKDGDVKAFIGKFYPEMLEQFQEVYPNNNDVPFSAPTIESLLRDSTTYEIVLFISSVEGLSKGDIARRFGSKGLDILEELLDNGIVQSEEDVSIGGTIHLSQDAVHMLLQHLVRGNYDLKAFGAKDNWMSVQCDAINWERVAPLLRDACLKMNQEVRAILGDPANRGSDVTWVGIAMDSLFKIKSSASVGEEKDGPVRGVLQ